MNEAAMIIERTPTVIASEIITIREQAKGVVLQAAMEIGKRLVEAKNLLPHGTFGTWLEDNVSYSERTAQNLMALSTEYSRMSNPEALKEISYSKAVALLGIPRGEREKAIEENDIESMSTREVEALVSELREKINAQQQQLSLLDGLEKDKAAAEARAKAAEEKRDKAVKAELAAQSKLVSANAATDREKQRADALRKQLNEPRPMEAVTVEKVPEEIERELDRLRAIEKQAPNKEVITFRTVYEDWNEKLTQLIGLIEKMPDEDAKQKYRRALYLSAAKVCELTGEK